MSGGFSLGAFAIRYGMFGLLIFVVNQEGVVYQKELGTKTVSLGTAMMLFNLDKS